MMSLCYDTYDDLIADCRISSVCLARLIAQFEDAYIRGAKEANARALLVKIRADIANLDKLMVAAVKNYRERHTQESRT